MTVRILRRLKVVEDVEQIAEFLAKDSLDAAVLFLERTQATLQDLAKSPTSGSPFLSNRPELIGMRFRRVQGFPNHVIFYVDRKDAIEVVRILHGARDLDAELSTS